LKNMPTEMQHNFRAALQGVFERLDLVTREEFDQQTALLQKARAQLKALEARFSKS